MDNTKKINWEALDHCPSSQLQQTETGVDIKIATNTWVKPYSLLSYEWEDVGVSDTLQSDIPELFSPENYDLFMSQDGLRTKIKYLVEFSPAAKSEVLLGLNKFPRVVITTHDETHFRVECQASKEKLLQIEGVESVSKVSLLQRRKYSPVLLPTGIRMAPEDLQGIGITHHVSTAKHAINLFSSTFDPYSGELLIGVYPLHGHTVIAQGESVAQLTSSIPVEFVRTNAVRESNSLKLAA